MLMRKLLRISLILTLVALAAVGGLLLAGDRLFRREVPAVRLVYDIDQAAGEGTVADAVAREAALALKQRLDRQGMREVQVRAAGPRVEVLAPASVPKADVKRMLAMGGVLSFHVVVEDPEEPRVPEMLARMQPGSAGPKPQPGDLLRWLPGTQAGISPVETSRNGVTYVLVHTTPDRAMTHDDPQRRWSVKHAQRTMDPTTGELMVAFELDARGAALFGELTGNNIGRRLAIALDGNLLSAPQVNSRINGHGIITGHREAGGFTDRESHQLAATLNAGSLPAKLSNEPVSEDYLTISLGLPPTTRFLLKCAAASLGAFAVVLLIARTLLRRFRPTPAEQMNRFLGNETT